MCGAGLRTSIGVMMVYKKKLSMNFVVFLVGSPDDDTSSERECSKSSESDSDSD